VTAAALRVVTLPDGGTATARLVVRVHRAPHARGCAVLVHGLASNARMWDACAAVLVEQGVTAVAVDLRGHGRSAALGAPGPFGTAPAAADVAALVEVLRADGTLTGPLVLAGQSWGGNVVLHVAARHPGTADAVALVDGGWLRFDADEPFERLWERLAPPSWDGTTWRQLVQRLTDVLGAWGPHALPAVLGNLTVDRSGQVRNVLRRDTHEQILRSMYDADPRGLYPLVDVPALLVPAGASPAALLVDEAAALLPRARVRRYDDAHHDLHLQHPDLLAGDLIDLMDLIDEQHDEEST
jgi:pimeloyl-ACP methyl ester carboxylesterase